MESVLWEAPFAASCPPISVNRILVPVLSSRVGIRHGSKLDSTRISIRRRNGRYPSPRLVAQSESAPTTRPRILGKRIESPGEIVLRDKPDHFLQLTEGERFSSMVVPHGLAGGIIDGVRAESMDGTSPSGAHRGSVACVFEPCSRRNLYDHLTRHGNSIVFARFVPRRIRSLDPGWL